MKRLIAIGVTALTMAVPASAEASNPCSGYDYFQNRSGWSISTSNYRNDRGMACSSVRYVMRFLRVKLRRQYGYPRITGPFFDGYVTWHCAKRTEYRWRCREFTSYTSFSFTARVYS